MEEIHVPQMTHAEISARDDDTIVALHTLLEIGRVTVDTIEQARAVIKMAYFNKVHLNDNTLFGGKYEVEVCQGRHCHCKNDGSAIDA